MAKFKSYNYDQTIMVPVNLQDQLVPVPGAHANK